MAEFTAFYEWFGLYSYINNEKLYNYIMTFIKEIKIMAFTPGHWDGKKNSTIILIFFVCSLLILQDSSANVKTKVWRLKYEQ